MARTTPVHTGYTIVNGVATGINQDKVDVWIEYKIGTPNVPGNYTPFSAFFYAALKPGQASGTTYDHGLSSTFTVDGQAGKRWTNIGYDFRTPSEPCVFSDLDEDGVQDTDDDGVLKKYLGRYTGNIAHDSDGKKTITISGSFTINTSTYISGGSASVTISLPDINGCIIYIDNGTSWDAYQMYVDNGTSWDLYQPYIDSGSSW